MGKIDAVDRPSCNDGGNIDAYDGLADDFVILGNLEGDRFQIGGVMEAAFCAREP